MDSVLHSASRLFLRRSNPRQAHCPRRLSVRPREIPLTDRFVEPAHRRITLSSIASWSQSRPISSASSPSSVDGPVTKVPLPRSTKLRQRCITPDSQQVFFDECGREDGVPVFFFHGFPSCGSEILALHCMAWRHGIRLIGPDRPGLGLSSPWPDERLTKKSDLRPDFFPIMEYPKQIAALAHHLKLGKFGVIGGSGGGPFAVSCANSLQQRIDEYTDDDLKRLIEDNITSESSSDGLLNDKEAGVVQARQEKPHLAAAGVLAGSGPYQFTGTKHMSLHARLLYEVIARSVTIGKLIALCFRHYTKRSGFNRSREEIRSTMKGPNEKIAKNTAEFEGVEFLIYILRNAFRSDWGAWTEARALVAAKGWGFDLEGIKFTAADGKGLRLWYGSDDKNTPLYQGRAIASRVSNSVLEIFEGVTHYSTSESMLEQVLQDTLTAMGHDSESLFKADEPPEDFLSDVLQLVKQSESEAEQRYSSSSSSTTNQKV